MTEETKCLIAISISCLSIISNIISVCTIFFSMREIRIMKEWENNMKISQSRKEKKDES
jgi:hypothetical protein